MEERDVRFVRLWFTDVLGFLKSVAIAPAELEGAFSEGIGFDGSAIQGFARVYESDMVAHPDPVSYTHLDVYKRQVFEIIDLPGEVVDQPEAIALTTAEA